jgi:hypothetical protein
MYLFKLNVYGNAPVYKFVLKYKVSRDFSGYKFVFKFDVCGNAPVNRVMFLSLISVLNIIAKGSTKVDL